MKILIVKLSAIGDVIHTLPALTALRRHYPDAQIDWLAEDAAADILRGHTALSRLLIWRRREFVAHLGAGKLLSATGVFLRSLRELRRTRYDLIIDFQALLKSSLWVFLARGLRKAGFDKGMEHAERSHLFLNTRIPAVSMEIHALDRGLILLQSLGIPGAPIVYDVPIGKEEEKATFAHLREKVFPSDQPLIAINPVAKWPTKLWLPEHFRQVADRLSNEGHRVVFTGGREDKPILDEICLGLNAPVVRLDGQTSLKMLAAVYRRAKVVIATDTGPMHLAAAVGTPVVALFGPTAPWRTGPHGNGHVVLRAGLNCSPCFGKSCRTVAFEKMACMKRITVGRVLEAVRGLTGLQGPGAGSDVQ